MLIIDTLASLDAVADPSLRPILERYRDMMDLAVILVTEPGDTFAVVELARGGPLADYELLEVIGSHFVVTYILSDYGEGQVLVVADLPETDRHLLECLKGYEP